MVVKCPKCEEMLLVHRLGTVNRLVFENSENVITCPKCNTKIQVSVNITTFEEKPDSSKKEE